MNLFQEWFYIRKKQIMYVAQSHRMKKKNPIISVGTEKVHPWMITLSDLVQKKSSQFDKMHQEKSTINILSGKIKPPNFQGKNAGTNNSEYSSKVE